MEEVEKEKKTSKHFNKIKEENNLYVDENASDSSGDREDEYFYSKVWAEDVSLRIKLKYEQYRLRNSPDLKQLKDSLYRSFSKEGVTQKFYIFNECPACYEDFIERLFELVRVAEFKSDKSYKALHDHVEDALTYISEKRKSSWKKQYRYYYSKCLWVAPLFPVVYYLFPMVPIVFKFIAAVIKKSDKHHSNEETPLNRRTAKNYSSMSLELKETSVIKGQKRKDKLNNNSAVEKAKIYNQGSVSDKIPFDRFEINYENDFLLDKVKSFNGWLETLKKKDCYNDNKNCNVFVEKIIALFHKLGNDLIDSKLEDPEAIWDFLEEKIDEIISVLKKKISSLENENSAEGNTYKFLLESIEDMKDEIADDRKNYHVRSVRELAYIFSQVGELETSPYLEKNVLGDEHNIEEQGDYYGRDTKGLSLSKK